MADELRPEALLDRDGLKVSKSPWGPDDEIGRLNWLDRDGAWAILERLNGRKVFDLSVDYFLGMSQAESHELVMMLREHMLQPKYVYKHKWAVNDALLWDNRRFMHAACGYRPTERRHGLRTTLAGPIRTGRYFDKNARAPSAVAAMD